MRNDPSHSLACPPNEIRPHAVSPEASLPPREQVLIDSLLDPNMEWRSEYREDTTSWHCSQPDPFLPNLDRHDEMGAVRGGRGSRLAQRSSGWAGMNSMHSTGWDWHSVKIQELTHSGEEYDISFSKTHTNWYSHSSRHLGDNVSYKVRLTDRADPTQSFAISGEQYDKLARIFDEIAGRIQ
jgi:hypothetical protein